MALTEFSADKAGVKRPQDSTWDIGAYEVMVGTQPSPLASPQNLRYVQ